jgi:hypothetical protein
MLLPILFLMAPGIKHRYTGVEYIRITDFTVTFKKEIFKLDELYKVMHEWLIENGYATRADEKFPEKYFLHKVSQAGKEVWVRWRLKKEPPGGVGFWRFDLDVDMHVMGLQDVEVVVGNKKVKANKGEVEVQVAASLILDAEGEWSKNALLKPFRKFFFNRVVSKKLDMMKKKIYTEAFEFRDIINNYLKMETFIPLKGAKAEFWPKRT